MERDRPAVRRTHRHNRRLAGLQEALSLCREVQAANRGKWWRPAARHCPDAVVSRVRPAKMCIGTPGCRGLPRPRQRTGSAALALAIERPPVAGPPSAVKPPAARSGARGHGEERAASSRPTMIDGSRNEDPDRYTWACVTRRPVRAPSREEMQTAGTRRFQRFPTGRFKAGYASVSALSRGQARDAARAIATFSPG